MLAKGQYYSPYLCILGVLNKISFYKLHYYALYLCNIHNAFMCTKRARTFRTLFCHLYLFSILYPLAAGWSAYHDLPQNSYLFIRSVGMLHSPQEALDHASADPLCIHINRSKKRCKHSLLIVVESRNRYILRHPDSLFV